MISPRSISWPLVLALSLAQAVGLAGLSEGEEVSSFWEVAKLTATDGAAFDEFGTAVALSGDTAVVGARYSDLPYLSGSAYMFERDAGGLGVWGQVAKLTAADGAAQDQFGFSVAISGDIAVVGGYLNDDAGTNSGSAYLFERDAGGPGMWGQVAKLTAADGEAYDQFGVSVAISGDTAVVGAHLDEGAGPTDSGSAYVFERNAGGPGLWGQVAKLTPADGGENDHFGRSVGISRDTAVVGADAELAPGVNSGSAYVFERDAGGAGMWGQVAKLNPADGAERDGFGHSVAISGDTAVVGGYLNDAAGTNSGSAYVFERDAGGPGMWGQVAKVAAADGQALYLFGISVAISADTAVVGAWAESAAGPAPGSAYVFERDSGGPGMWLQVAKVAAADGAAGDLFGSSVTISGDTAVVGALADDAPGVDSGSAYVFERILIDPAPLAISGTCPGEITIAASGFTPRGLVELYGAFSPGSYIVRGGPCVGTQLDLEAIFFRRKGRANETGGASLTGVLEEAQCGAHLQVVDLTSCATNQAVVLP